MDASPAGLGSLDRRGNAVEHGMTATTLLPTLLGGDALARYEQQLRAEWQPTSPTEEILLSEMARHAAAMDISASAEGAVLRCGARSAMGCLGQADSYHDSDSILSGAVTNDGIDRLTRYRRAHEKAFHTALLRLQEMSSDRRPSVAFDPDLCFASEEACETYLLRRADSEKRCPHCGGTHGYRLETRRRWECAGADGRSA